MEDEVYELFFGDGVLGKKLEDGEVVEISYVVTNGPTTNGCLLYTSPSPRDLSTSRMPSSA